MTSVQHGYNTQNEVSILPGPSMIHLLLLHHHPLSIPITHLSLNLHHLPSQNAHHFLYLKLPIINFLYWKTQLIPFFGGQDHLDFIDGSNPCPPVTVTPNNEQVSNPAFVSWTHQDQLLMSFIISSLSNEVLPTHQKIKK